MILLSSPRLRQSSPLPVLFERNPTPVTAYTAPRVAARRPTPVLVRPEFAARQLAAPSMLLNIPRPVPTKTVPVPWWIANAGANRSDRPSFIAPQVVPPSALLNTP